MKQLTATKLRTIMIFLVIITLAGASVGFYFAFGWIKSYSDEVNTVIIAAAESGETAGSVNSLQEQLQKQQEIITAANSLFALNSNYQTQVIKDIYTYAEKTGITVSDIQLDTATQATNGSSNTSTTASSLPTKSITASLSSPVNYTDLLKFLTLIESNIPKMQISGVDLTRPADSSNTVQISTVTIAVYVR